MASTQILITGNSRGLGCALTELYLRNGHRVYGLSRRGCGLRHDRLQDRRVDLEQIDTIQPALTQLLQGVDALEVVYLNAAVLGTVGAMSETALDAIHRVMNINLWANKVLLDWLIQRALPVRQIVLISSGAAVRGGYGWSAYSLSKAGLNMLAQLYAHEFPATHICALAPGLIDTDMQQIISDPEQVDAARFADFRRLRDARAANQMPGSERVADIIATSLARLRQTPSGSFQDIRDF